MREQLRSRRSKSKRVHRGAVSSVALVVALCALASAQVSPEPGHTTVGPGAGLDGATSPTGGFAVQVPLELPPPRGDLPVPLAIAYTGSPRAGAAGQGWDIPLSYVRRSTSTWRRKPYANHPTGSGEAPIGAERVTLSLGGQVNLMSSMGGVWRPTRGSDYMELRETGDGWSLKTLNNLEYVFRPAGALNSGVSDANLWLLAEIRDSIGGDKVVLGYDVPEVGDCAVGLGVARLAYGFDAAGTTPLYEVRLEYAPVWVPLIERERDCARRTPSVGGGEEMAIVFEHVREDTTIFDRSQVVRQVKVLARNNLAPSSSLKVIRAFKLEYDVDPIA